MKLSSKRITKALICLRGCAGWSAPLLFANHRSQVLSRRGPIFIIRLNYECQGRIEKSVPRITVWHHEACRVMTNGDPEGRIILANPHTNNGFFFLLTTVFIIHLLIYFKISFQKSLKTLRCNFTRWRYLTSWVR